MTPPASTEPMYLISESELSELEIDSSEDTYGCTDGIEIAERIRARGPVQQAPAITRNLQKIKQCSSEMKYLSDEEIISRCLSMMAAMFSANADRKKEPVVFFDE